MFDLEKLSMHRLANRMNEYLIFHFLLFNIIFVRKMCEQFILINLIPNQRGRLYIGSRR